MNLKNLKTGQSTIVSAFEQEWSEAIKAMQTFQKESGQFQGQVFFMLEKALGAIREGDTGRAAGLLKKAAEVQEHVAGGADKVKEPKSADKPKGPSGGKDVSAEFHIALNKYLAHCKKVIEAYNKKKGYTHIGSINMAVEWGNRFVRVYRVEDGKKAIFAFIDATNGDILKPAGYKAPAKGARGNIFDERSFKRTGAYGPEYLIGPKVGF